MDLKNGIYHLTNEEYHALPAISSSHLVVARDALRKFWFESHYNPNKPENPETKALRIGRAMHTFLLEPDRFEREYKVCPMLKDHPDALVYYDDLKQHAISLGINPRGMKKADLVDNLVCTDTEAKIWDWMIEEFRAGVTAGNYTEISGEDNALIRAMAEALADEVIELPDIDFTFTMRDVFRKGKAEESFVWQEPTTGLWLKCRSDWRLGDNLIFEYRTARDASPWGFKRDVENRNYHIRAGMYHHIIQQLTGKPQRFVYVAQEKEGPHLAGMYEQEQKDLEAGWTLAYHLLAQIKKCLDKGDPADRKNWPGYNDGKIARLELSDYSMQA